jgi:Raf kinase inhibitor-like YbhB/YbcL family protein
MTIIVYNVVFFTPTNLFIAKKYRNNMKVTSVFMEGENIPIRYTCDGDSINPPMEITDIPDKTKSIAVIMDDPDAPMGTFVHWVAWNVPVEKKVKIEEETLLGMRGNNGAGKLGYTGPCPPNGTHRYFFKVYALSKHLILQEGATKAQLEKAMHGHII